jgi:hypothetical protein
MNATTDIPSVTCQREALALSFRSLSIRELGDKLLHMGSLST